MVVFYYGQGPLGMVGATGGLSYARTDPYGRTTYSPGGALNVGMQVGGGSVRGVSNLGAGMFIGPQGAQQYRQWLGQQGYITTGTGSPTDPLRVMTQGGQQLSDLSQVRIGGGFDFEAQARARAAATHGGAGGGAPGFGPGPGGPMMELAKRELARKYAEARKRLEEQFHARGMARSGQYFAALRALERDEADALAEAGLRAQLADQARMERMAELAQQRSDRLQELAASARGVTSGGGVGWTSPAYGTGGTRIYAGAGTGDTQGGGVAVPDLSHRGSMLNVLGDYIAARTGKPNPYSTRREN